MVDPTKVDVDTQSPYFGELSGTLNPYWRAIGPGVHVVCRSKEQANDVAAALNAAFTFGVLHQMKKGGSL